jgi:ParB-like chromosome segregation protein Spo0J
MAAVRQQTPLPPVALVHTLDGYWIADGHNRLALAKAMGQLWIDAEVVEIGDLGGAEGRAGSDSA